MLGTVPWIDLSDYTSWDEAQQAILGAYACKHQERQLTQRPVAGGAVQIVYQCSNCGAAASSPEPRAKHPDWQRLPLFREDCYPEWETAKSDALSQAFEHFREGRAAEYDAYLRSDAWRRRRSLVMERAKGRCEGCGERAATQVHHLSYEHKGEEFLWELVAICEQCHKRIHGQER